MNKKSELFNIWYNTVDTIVIPNMQQNYFYLGSELSKGALVDIICGDNNRVCFVWQKTDGTRELYKEWCSRGSNG